MSDGVAIPAWLLVVMAALAVWALYEHAVAPALRFLVTHPANQVIDELGERLRIGIRPFQRTKRQALIHSLLADRRVQAAAEKYAREKDVTLPAALRRVERYAREIVPAFNAYLYFRIGFWIGRGIARSLYRVRIGYVDSEGIAKVGSDATVVFVMNHRSNMDYVLAAYLAADQAALSYAVGEWARIWPLSALDGSARAGRGPLQSLVEHPVVRRAQSQAHAEERMASLRLRLRQFRLAGLDARLLRLARPGFPAALRRGAQTRDCGPGRTPHALGRPGRSGGAGAADGDRVRAQSRAQALRARAEGRGRTADRAARSLRSARLRAEARSRLCARRGPADAAHAAPRRRGPRDLPRAGEGAAAPALLRELHRSSAGLIPGARVDMFGPDD